jgi:hypothetical protein
MRVHSDHFRFNYLLFVIPLYAEKSDLLTTSLNKQQTGLNEAPNTGMGTAEKKRHRCAWDQTPVLQHPSSHFTDFTVCRNIDMQRETRIKKASEDTLLLEIVVCRDVRSVCIFWSLYTSKD